MKKLLLIASIVTAVLALPLQDLKAEGNGLQTTLLNGGTNAVVNASTNTYATVNPVVFTVTKNSSIHLVAKYAMNGAGTAAIPIWFDGSDDNVNWVTNGLPLWSLTPAGTAEQRAVTNLSSAGFAFIRVRQVGNLNTTDVTNLYLTGFTKSAGF